MYHCSARVSYLIVFKSSPDVDHMAPLAWKLLEEGETVHAVMSASHDVAGDHRFALLDSYPACQVHELRPAPGDTSRARALAGNARASLPYALWMLRRHRVRLLAVDWGYGLPDGYERLRSPAGAVAVAKSLGASLVRGGQWLQPRASFVVAARLLGIPTVCLPHGLSVKLDLASNDEIAAVVAAKGSLDVRDRNRFAAYVLNSEHHRQLLIEDAHGDPEVMQTWGALRWAPEWFEVNRGAAPRFDWPGDGLRVLFMVPKWHNRVRVPAAVELVCRIQAVAGISLAVMGHPRLGIKDSDPLRADPRIDWSRLHDVSGHNSVSVIREADVVVDVGSSIGIEVVLQGKVLVNPAYVHELNTLFDSIAGTTVRAQSADEVVAYLQEHAAGRRHVVSDAAREELLRQAVYGLREPFDVPALYYERVRELAARAS